jgi:hypothetical protein
MRDSITDDLCFGSIRFISQIRDCSARTEVIRATWLPSQDSSRPFFDRNRADPEYHSTNLCVNPDTILQHAAKLI